MDNSLFDAEEDKENAAQTSLKNAVTNRSVREPLQSHSDTVMFVTIRRTILSFFSRLDKFDISRLFSVFPFSSECPSGYDTGLFRSAGRSTKQIPEVRGEIQDADEGWRDQVGVGSPSARLRYF